MAQNFEQSISLKPSSSPDTFTNTHPPWTWPASPVVPGGTLMAMSASAARTTVLSDSYLNNLQIHFLAGPERSKPITFSVTKVSEGRRFQVRYVSATQDSKPMCFVTMTFMAAGTWKGKSMKHSSPRQTTASVPHITLDDLESGRATNPSGPFMKFQRLPLLHPSNSPVPEQTIAPIVCQITPPITSTAADPFTQILGILSLSDYHVLSFPPTAHAVPFGLSPIGAPPDQRLKSHLKLFTSLNHTIHFHVHDGFRADELTYVEVTSSWARDGRAVIHSKIFSQDGMLIATCVQEAYYVLKDEAQSRIGSKL